jgi:hypothetical protein
VALATSRYSSVAQATFIAADGTRAPYLKRRFIPDPDRVQPAGTVTVRPGERIDLVASRAMGDPAHFWRICDANRIADPFVVTGWVGVRLVLPLPTTPSGTGSG